MCVCVCVCVSVCVCLCANTFYSETILHYEHNAFPNATTARIPSTSPT